MTGDLDLRRGVALAFGRLAEVGPARLRQMALQPDAAAAWAAVRAGHPPIRGVADALARRWVVESGSLDPLVELDRHERAGVGIAVLGEDGYPPWLAADRSPPGLLVWRGAWPDLAQTCGVVGTRRCSRYGRDVARSLGAELAASGVVVVSGLALGIDGAAHGGALAAGRTAPIGVVAGGVDRVYPSRHAELWAQVAEHGLLLSECPLGVEPVRWRFPARNRVIAALSRAVVVVESDLAGGSMVTVREAAMRGRDVLAVPGPVTSATSRGTNQLLAEGCGPCRDATDVLVALGLSTATLVPQVAPPAAPAALDPTSSLVLDELGAERRSLEQLATALALPLGELALTLEFLLRKGLVEEREGWWEATR